MPPLVSTIREIRNRSKFAAAVRNLEPPGSQIDLATGEKRSVQIAIPWCSDGKDFEHRHLVITAGQPGATQTFAVWQHTALWTKGHEGDRVCVSTDGMYHDPGQEIGGYASIAVLGDDRVLIITDTFLWLLPFGSPLLNAIVQIRNASEFPAVVRNVVKATDTADDRGRCAPNDVVNSGMLIPWSSDATDFATKRIDVIVGPAAAQRTFSLWQEMHDLTQIRIRVSGDLTWRPDADVIGIYAAVGPIELGIFGNERVLVITDEHLWLLPASITDLIDGITASVAQKGSHICDDRDPRTKESLAIPSNPKLSATAFSMAGIVSDLFDGGAANPQLRYRDSGKRYDFTIARGSVTVQPPPRKATSIRDPSRQVDALTEAVSYNRLRRGESIPVPAFDLIAANGGRVFCKEQGVDRFYFAVIDHEFIHATPERGPFSVPGSYFKVDPEFNTQGAQTGDLTAHLDGAFGRHPATMRFPLFRFALGLKLAAGMVVAARRGAWHLIDARPSSLNPVDTENAFQKVLGVLDATRSALHGLPIAVAALDSLRARIESEHHWIPQVLDISPPAGTTGYDHVSWCQAQASPDTWQKSISFSRVLDIGVGHVHFHQQYEGVTGGEMQASRAASNPNWFFDHKQIYQFFNGPVRDGDGFNDGTCNYYLLVALRDGGPFAVLFLDEQSFFSPRWRLADPRDSNGTMVTLAADLATNAGSYNWNKSTF